VPDAFELLNRHVKISRETFERLSLYHNLLIKWQARVNLVGPESLQDAWQRHFLDSLQLLNAIESVSQVMVDLGSGAGFPGMALAIAGANNMHLVESDGKKISFLREVARITETKISIHHSRMEDCVFDRVDIFTARAVAPLKELFSSIEPNVSHGTFCLFQKGKNSIKEMDDAKEEWSFDSIIIPSVTDKEGSVLRVSNLKRWGKNEREKGRKL
jgi:16S rRNA (guanine527-N7)-methyltransferase